jgi:Flp pilus assembly protein TadG
MAIVTPILITMLFGIIEYGWLFTVRQALVSGAREGARTASLPGSTSSEVQQRVTDYMTPLGISGYTTTVTMDPNDPASPSGRVNVAVPYAQVSLLGHYFGHTSGNLEATAEMRKETSN